MKHILCVRLKNWPIDRLRRQQRRDNARPREATLSISAPTPSDDDLSYSTLPRRAHGRVVTEQRKRRWTHRMWREGPEDCVLPVAPGGIANCKLEEEIRFIEPPLLIVRTVASRQVILAASDEAAARGIRVGMTLAEARALCADVEHAEHDPTRDAIALEALARWMIRFTPAVSIAPIEDGHGIYLDVTGCERLYGRLDDLAASVARSLESFGISVGMAIAPTPGAAWALASCSTCNRIVILRYSEGSRESRDFRIPRSFGVPQDDSGPGFRQIGITSIADALAPLPPSALRLDPETIDALHHLGIESIGQLARLPRQSIPARFGDRLLLRLDQALGHIPEPLIPLQPRVSITARMDFDGVVDSLETIWIVFKELIRQLITQLLRHGRGARQLKVEFFRDGAPPITKTIDLSRPSRDPVNLFNLLRCAGEGEGEKKGRRDRGTKALRGKITAFRPSLRASPHTYSPNGYTAVRITVTVSEPLDDEQIFLLEHEEYAGQVDLDHLIERLSLRLGAEAMERAEIVQSHVPEKAWRRRRDGMKVKTTASDGAVKKKSRDKGIRFASDEGRAASWPSITLIRPLHLFPSPREIRVTVSPSEDRDGRPISLTARTGRVHRLVHAVGPERIAGEWWEGHNKSRDYFDAEDEGGKRFWLFRVNETGRWFWQGSFE